MHLRTFSPADLAHSYSEIEKHLFSTGAFPGQALLSLAQEFKIFLFGVHAQVSLFFLKNGPIRLFNPINRGRHTHVHRVELNSTL